MFAKNYYEGIEEIAMKKIIVFIFGVLIGVIIGTLLKGSGSNNGSEFWGDEFAEVAKGACKGNGNNGGSKFYSDLYIKERFKNENIS